MTSKSNIIFISLERQYYFTLQQCVVIITWITVDRKCNNKGISTLVTQY